MAALAALPLLLGAAIAGQLGGNAYLDSRRKRALERAQEMLQAARSSAGAAPQGAEAGVTPDQRFLAFAQAARQAGIDLGDWSRAQELRDQQAFLGSPAVAALPIAQQAAIRNRLPAPSWQIEADTAYSPYGATPSMEPTPRGVSVMEYNRARAEQARAARRTQEATASLRRAQEGRARIYGRPIDVNTSQGARKAVLMAMPSGEKRYVLIDVPEGVSLPPYSQPRPAGQRQKRIPEGPAPAPPAATQQGQAAESFEWEGKSFTIGQELSHRGKRYRVVGRWPNGEPSLEELR